MAESMIQLSAGTIVDNDALKLTDFQVERLRQIASKPSFGGLVEPNINLSRPSSGPMLVRWWEGTQLVTEMLGKYRTVRGKLQVDGVRSEAAARLAYACRTIDPEPEIAAVPVVDWLKEYKRIRNGGGTSLQLFAVAAKAAEAMLAEANQRIVTDMLATEEKFLDTLTTRDLKYQKDQLELHGVTVYRREQFPRDGYFWACKVNDKLTTTSETFDTEVECVLDAWSTLGKSPAEK